MILTTSEKREKRKVLKQLQTPFRRPRRTAQEKPTELTTKEKMKIRMKNCLKILAEVFVAFMKAAVNSKGVFGRILLLCLYISLTMIFLWLFDWISNLFN